MFVSLLIVFFKRTWTEADIVAPTTLQIGLRVRITAERKAWYTLLLGFPVSRILKLIKWLFPRNGSFRLASKHRFAQYTESEEEHVSKNLIPLSSYSQRYNQPTYRVESCMCM